MRLFLTATAFIATIAMPAFAANNEIGDPTNSSTRATTQRTGATANAQYRAFGSAVAVAAPRRLESALLFNNRAPGFDPENSYDPDPRIGGSFKMNTSGND